MPDPPAGDAAEPARGAGGRTGRRRSYIALLIVLLAATGFAQTTPGQDLLRSAGVTGATGAYSGLAFGSPAELPRKLLPGADLPPLPFIVHNATGSTRTYHWTVELAGSGEERRVAAGQATLVDGGSIVITPKGRVSCTGGPVRVSVRLDRRHSIDYHATCASADTGRQE